MAYREAENLKTLIPKLHEVLDEAKLRHEIIVIDSMQPTDNTEEICHQNLAKYVPQEEPNYGGAFRTGIKHTTGEKIVVLDADWSHDPVVIPTINQKFDEGYDLVIGSRYVKGGVTNDSKSSYVMSKILNTVMRLWIGVKAKDISTSYRMYDAKQLKEILLIRQNYDILQEVILKMKLQKKYNKHQIFKIGEVPIVFGKRMYGDSKRRLFEFILGYIVSMFMLAEISMKAAIVKHL